MVGNDTIAAISTPQGAGGIGVLRISGKDAFNIGEKILRHPSGKPVTTWPERKVRLGFVTQPEGEILDQVLFFTFNEPRSYTGENVLEIQGHGGSENLKLILDNILKAGARLAEPGEFTKRAFLNGRMDLTQAEAVIDLVYAQTNISHKTAILQLSGELSKILNQIEEELFNLLVPIEAALDYPEDELPELERAQMLSVVTKVRREIKSLIAEAEKGRILREAATVVLAGRPNVGKSSLLNSLLNEKRAIVTPIPGTTRDFVTETINLEGIPIRLVDTAGLREVDDLVEREGVNRAWDWVSKADLVLFIIDSAMRISSEDQKAIKEIHRILPENKVFLVLNKSDLPPKITPEQLRAEYANKPVLSVSSLTGEGIGEVKKTIKNKLVGADFFQEHTILVTRIRHKNALVEAEQYLSLVEEGLISGMSEDLISIDLHAALDSIGQITGRVITTEVIDKIFSQFCVGK